MKSFWTDKSVLVTGGSGFLGSHVLEKLRDAGCKQIFVVRSRDFDLTREEQVARLFEKHPEPKCALCRSEPCHE